MSTLFESGAPRPLADRLRPNNLSEVVGQDHLLSGDGPISRMVESRKPGGNVVRAALEGNDKVAIYDYEGQGHAFARVGGQHYHQASAEAARERTLDLFKTHLG